MCDSGILLYNAMKRYFFIVVIVFKYVLVAAGVVGVLAFLAVAYARMDYPYELEWMEGGAVDHVMRVVSGQPLYVRPSLVFTPFIYTPLYFYLSGLLSLATGVGFLPLRLVSTLASLGCMALIFEFVRRESGSSFSGAAAAGLFAACFKVGGAWYDMGRADMLFLALALGAIYALRFYPGTRGALWAALLGWLAFMSKQTALIVMVPLCLARLREGRGSGRFVFPAALAALVGGSTLAYNALSGGWFAYYIFDLPGRHALHFDMLPDVLTVDLFFLLPGMAFLALVYAFSLLAGRRAQQRPGDLLFHLMAAAGLVGAGVSGRIHAGGYVNVLIPAFAGAAIYAGLGLHVLLERAGIPGGLNVVKDARAAAPTGALTALAALGLLAGLGQFWLLRYPPLAQIPGRADQAAGDALVEMVAAVDGEVYIPYHGYLAALAGKTTQAQGMALEDVFRSSDEEGRDVLKAEIREAIQGRRFAAIILDGEWRFMAEIEANYSYAGPIFEDEDVFWPATGMPTRPQRLYLVRTE
jgi:hypothetical protein